MNLDFRSLQFDYESRLRRRRFHFFETMIEKLEKPVRVLDCGGTAEFWQTNANGSSLESKFDITIINLTEPKDDPGYAKWGVGKVRDEEAMAFQKLVSRIKWHTGDVRDLSRFRDREFDVVFSNAVLNLMPGWEDQIRMSKEIMRVGRRYFVQSPNRHFPIDWRTLVPCFHFLSPEIQAWCFSHFRVGSYRRVKDRKKAYMLATRVHDLTVMQMRALFPGCNIFREPFFGFTKSLTAYSGWSQITQSAHPFRLKAENGNRRHSQLARE